MSAVAISNAAVAAGLVLGLLDRVMAISQLLANSRAQGRDVSDEEIDALIAEAGFTRSELVQAIAERKAREQAGVQGDLAI